MHPGVMVGGPNANMVGGPDANMVGGPNAMHPGVGTVGGLHGGDKTPFENLVIDLDIPKWSIGKLLSEQTTDVSWQEVLSKFDRITNLADDASITNLIAEYGIDLETLYFLTVIGNRFQVIHGLRPCHLVPGGGSRLFCLLGDRIIRQGGLEVHPKLYKLPGALGNQANEGFARISARATSWETIKTALQDANTMVAPAGTAEDPEVATFKAIPIHAKLASVFLHGWSIPQGIMIVQKIMDLVPAIQLPGLNPLIAFTKVAATDNGTGGSTISASWTVMNPAEHVGLEEWYLKLLEREVPRRRVAAQPAPQPPAPPQNSIQPSDQIAQTLAQAIQLLSSTRATDGQTPRSQNYAEHELMKIFPWIGAPTPHQGLGEEVLPLIFKKLKPFRGKDAQARCFLEQYLQSNYPQDRERYRFVWSNELVKSLRQLDFGGQDESLSFQNRHKGVSIFSLAPLEPNQDGTAARDAMIAYESTTANHRPEDAQKMKNMTAALMDIPCNHDRVRRMVDHCEIWLSLHLGQASPVLTPLRSLLSAMQDPTLFRNFSEHNYRSIVWNVHIGIRKFFAHDNLRSLEVVPYSISVGLALSDTNLPPELRTHSTGSSFGSGESVPGSAISDLSTSTDGSTYGNGSRDSGPPGANKRAKFDRQPPDCVFLFANDIERAAQATPSKRMYAKLLAPSPEATKALFGPEFLALMNEPGKKQPCIRHFIMGKCQDTRCHNGHLLSRKPAKFILDGLKKRVKDACERIVQTPPKE